MNTASEHCPSVLSLEIAHVLEKAPTAENIAHVNTWLEGHAIDPAFWRSLTKSDVAQMEIWVLSNRRVQASWALSATVCLAVTLFFSAHPLEALDREPILAVLFMLVLTALTSFMVFPVLFAPLTYGWNFLLRIRPASRLSKKLDSVYDGELDTFYKKVGHFPAACQYIYDVKKHRTVIAQDLVVASALVPPDASMAADSVTH